MYKVNQKWRTRGGKEVVITKVKYDIVYTTGCAVWIFHGMQYNNGKTSDNDLITLLEPFDVNETIKTLEEAGYTVTPPPPKLAGTVSIFRTKNSSYIFSMSSIQIDRSGLPSANIYDTIAIVDWTEGDGLTTTE